MQLGRKTAYKKKSLFKLKKYL